MRKVIHRLRERPAHERRAIAAGTALSLTAVLFVGWGAFFLNSLGGSNTATNYAATEAAVAAPKTPQPTVVSNPSQPQIQVSQSVDNSAGVDQPVYSTAPETATSSPIGE
jgi:hypothetical protein